MDKGPQYRTWKSKGSIQDTSVGWSFLNKSRVTQKMMPTIACCTLRNEKVSEQGSSYWNQGAN